MSIAKAVERALKKQRFIGRTVKTDDYEGEIERRCGMCHHRYGGENYKKQINDCEFVPPDSQPTPKQMFGFREKEFLPETLGYHEVGYYCPYFKPYTEQ